MIGRNARIMCYKVCFRLCVILFFGMQYSASAVVIYANERSTVTLSCSSSTDYPAWKGPEGVYNYRGSANFNPALGEKLNRLSWGQNKRDLLISNAMRSDRGQYDCNVLQMNLSVRVPPSSPTVMETEHKVNVGLIVRGSEGVMLTLTCRSSGGFPASDIVWMKGSTSLQTITNKTYMNSSETFNIIGTHTFTPSSSDDGVQFICKTFFESGPENAQQTLATLFLNLKPSKPTAIQISTVSAGGNVDVRCATTGSRPAANISWSYQGSTTTGEMTVTLDGTAETYTVVSVFRKQVTAADNGRIVKCIVTHPTLINPSEETRSVNLNVYFKPLTATIIGNSNVIANGKNTLPLVCTSGSSNPISEITWRINSVITPSNGSLSDQSGEYGGMKRRRRLTLTPTRDNDDDSISCEAHNSIGTSERTKVSLDLRYRPLIKPMSEIIAVEGNTTVLTCVASSKPASTFKWYREGHSEILHHGTGTLDSNKLTYTIRNVRRTDTAAYRCNANNGIETADNENVLLTVYYPPDVTASTTNTTVKAETILIMCNARGAPNSSYRYGKWTQTWPGYNFPVSEKPGSELLVLTDVTYEHSGVYTCSASNGIKVFGTDKEFMEGSVQLLVKSFPIFTNVSKKIPAKLNGNATVEVHYYSNIAGSSVKINRNRNGARQGVIYTVSQARVEINLPVFKHIIKTGGTRARILIQIHSMYDLGLYDVVVSNEIDSDTRSFEIVPKGPPSKPYDVRVDMIQYNKARLSWIRGYHGGFAQTFVIQLSNDLSNWRNVIVYGGNDESSEPVSHVLCCLHDSTTYYVRMYAFNKEGNSSFTENLNYTTPSIKEKECGYTGDNSALIVGLVLGLVIVFVVPYAIYITVQQRRKQVFIQKEDISEQANEQMYVNLAVSPEGGVNIKKKKERENNTSKDDTPSENQYTELNKQLRDQESAYEAISSM